MKEQKIITLKDPSVLFLSFFGVGFFPKAPGTMGTLACLPILILFSKFPIPWPLYLPLIFFLTVGSCFIADLSQKKYSVHDPSWIVIDEVIGMWITWLFMQNNSVLDFIIAFALFRFFDIVKIWPASYFDKEVKHGAGTILDDVISGLFAGAILWLLYHFKFL